MLKQELQNNLNEALKSGEKIKRLVLGVLLSSIKNKEVEKRTKLSKSSTDGDNLEEQSQLNDEEIIGVIGSEIKKRKESIEMYRTGDREELAKKEQEEMDILKNYMPEQLDEEKIKEEIKKAISETGAESLKDMGKVINVVMSKFKGQVEGGTVSKIVKELLQLGD